MSASMIYLISLCLILLVVVHGINKITQVLQLKYFANNSFNTDNMMEKVRALQKFMEETKGNSDEEE